MQARSHASPKRKKQLDTKIGELMIRAEEIKKIKKKQEEEHEAGVKGLKEAESLMAKVALASPGRNTGSNGVAGIPMRIGEG